MPRQKKPKKWKSESDRAEYYFWMNQVFEALEARKNRIFVVRMHMKKWKGRHVGFYDPDKDRIYIDIRGDMIPTLIHEALHAYFSPWEVKREERAVREVEKAVMQTGSLTAGHMVRLSKYLLTKNGLLAKKFPMVHFDD